ncbi:uncharacterized protein LOC143218018 [Lasioglossum baleicum]|uniref:uncharacterized protein LOC143218018 n=1 Tax=Lasioglossum baleicum TaxID=434251 RepID=UPI003FCD9758
MEGEESKNPPTTHPHSPLPTEAIIKQMWECMQQSAERENRYIENQELLLQQQEQLQESVARLDKKLEQLRRIAVGEQHWERPDCLPLCSVAEVGNFESGPAEVYDSVVEYFVELGGYSLKEVVNASFKEALSDTVAASYTWSGANGTRPLYRTRIIHAIFAAAMRNKYFSTTKRDFGKAAKAALKAAKQRIRPRGSRGALSAAAAARKHWQDHNDDDDDDDDDVAPLL